MQLSHKVRSRGRTTLRSGKALVIILSTALVLAVGYRFINRSKVFEVSRTFPTLGTFATVIITVESESSQILLDKADSLLSYLDNHLGRFSEYGQLYDLNSFFQIQSDTELAELIRMSHILVAVTGGSFDPSLGALSIVWGFPEPVEVPDSSSINHALACSGWDERVYIGEDSIFIEQNTVMDFGAIAKGYAVDRTYELLIELGATECLVEVGGEIRCGSSTGRIWHIGVRHPREDTLVGILELTAGAVATSGDYECYFFENGIRYSHLLDSETGYPSGNAASATVVANDCATADAMATAAAVAGPVRAGMFPEENYIGMLIITADENDNCESFQFGELPWTNQ